MNRTCIRSKIYPNLTDSVPVVGGAVAPVLGAVGGSTSGNPLGAVGGAVSGALGTVGQVAGSVPVVGGAVQGAVNTVGQAVNSALLGPYPLNQGVSIHHSTLTTIAKY